MTSGRYDRLDFNSPLSDERAALLLAEAELKPGERAVDLGCGWGELLIRAVRGAPGSTGDGVDSDPELLERGRRNARKTGNTRDTHDARNAANAGSARDAQDTHDARNAGNAHSSRNAQDTPDTLNTPNAHDAHDESPAVTFHQADAATWPGTGYDLAISIGSSHAWPDGTAGTLATMKKCLKPGGRAILGEGFWERPPTPAAQEVLGENLSTLPDLVDQAIGAGFRPLLISTASRDEWEVFESRWCGGVERWLLQNPDDESARATVDAHRTGWLRGYRDVLGLAYLVLVSS